MQSLSRSILTSLSLLAPAAQAQIELPVTNPGFEDPAIADGVQYNTPPGWVVGGSGIWNPWDAAYPNGGVSGENIGYADTGALAQVLFEPYVVGERYTLRVRVGNRADWPIGPFEVGFITGTAFNFLSSTTGPVPAPGEWTEIVHTYTVQPGDIVPGASVAISMRSFATQVNFDDVRVFKAEPLRVPSEFATIQSAIDAAIDGHTILVDSGTYAERINLQGKAITLEGVGPTRPVIDAGGTGRAVTCNSGESSSTILRNLRLTGAVAGGLGLFGAAPRVELCEIDGNSNFDGGGVQIDTNAPEPVVFENCLFHSNVAGNAGGAVSTGSDVILRGCTVANNEANHTNQHAGGLYVWASRVELESCVFWGNVWNASTPYELEALGPGVEIVPNYCNIEGGWSGPGSEQGTGNLDVDPQFVFAPFGDYRLLPGSPMIDAGVATWELDLDLQPRVVDDLATHDSGPGAGPHADIGAYEFEGSPPPTTVLVPSQCPTIQEAIDIVADFGEVVIEPGTYSELFDLDGRPITIRSTDVSNPAVVAATILDGGGSGPIARIDSGETQATTLLGLTLRNAVSFNGGAVLIENSTATIQLCVFEDNVANSTGGAIFCRNANAFLDDCTFRRNSASGSGGAVVAREVSHLSVSDCRFLGGTATFGGGVSVSEHASGTFLRCLFRGNVGPTGSSLFVGGDVDAFNCRFVRNGDGSGNGTIFANQPTAGAVPVANLTNCLIADNDQGSHGGLTIGSAHVTLSNCTLANNEVQSGSSAIGMFAGTIPGSLLMLNSIVWGNTGSATQISTNGQLALVEYSIVEGGFPGVGVLDQDPRFRSAQRGDYRLRSRSPAIDAGANWALPIDRLDMNGNLDSNEIIPWDLDDLERTRDAAHRADTGLGGSPLVDLGPFEFALQATDFQRP